MTHPSSLIPHPPGPVGLLGGTFDPPHLAHLVAAECARHQFGLQRVIFLPAGDPWRKTGRREEGAGRSREEQPSAGGTAGGVGAVDFSLLPSPSALPSGDSSLFPLSSSLRDVTIAAHRLEMTRLAIQDNDAFLLDDRETQRPGPTFTVDTLEELHAELRATVEPPPSGRQPALPRREAPLPAAEGGAPPLPSSLFPHPYLLLGSDALADLPHWKSPGRIKELAQIIIAPRPGFDIASSPYPVIDMPVLEVSSTLVRDRIAAGKPIRYLVPPAVEAYIHDHALYR